MGSRSVLCPHLREVKAKNHGLNVFSELLPADEALAADLKWHRSFRGTLFSIKLLGTSQIPAAQPYPWLTMAL